MNKIWTTCFIAEILICAGVYSLIGFAGSLIFAGAAVIFNVVTYSLCLSRQKSYESYQRMKAENEEKFNRVAGRK